MQKIFTVVALVTLLGLASAGFNTANGTWSVNPREVANASDSILINAAEVRLVSSGNNVVLQGVTGDNVTEKTISTKDLSASNNKTYNLTGDVGSSALNQVVAWDTRIVPLVTQDNNKVYQINVTKYKLVGSGASNQNPQVITSWKNNQTVVTLVPNSGVVLPSSNRYYVAATVLDNGTYTLVVVGVDVSGTKTSLATIANNVQQNPQVAIAGVPGTKSLYVVWTQNDTNVVGAKVDSDGKVADADVRVVATGVPTSVRAWAAGNSYGSLVQNGGKWTTQSSTNNFSNVDIALSADTITNVLPRNDVLAVFLRNANGDLNVQYIDRNGTLTNTTNLVTAGSSVQVLQHKDGSVYVSDYVKPTSVNVGQVWGDTHLSASTLQAAVYACIGLVTALFVF